MIKPIKRTHCPICDHEEIEHLQSLSDYPVFMGCVDQPIGEDILADMDWVICRYCGALFLENLIPLELLYPEQHNASVGSLWTQHHNEFAKFILAFEASRILEIGGAHGMLESEYRSIHPYRSWTIVEPNPSPAEGCRAKFIKIFFDENFKFEEPFDVVVHSHVFEHIYNPDEFIQHLSNFMDEGKYLLFSIPNMQAMLERKYTNCINFEHTVYLTEPYINFLLTKHGFRVESKKYFMDDHSIFYAAVRDSNCLPAEIPSGLYELNKKTFLDFVVHHQRIIIDLNNKIESSEAPVYLFGAHIFAQHLIEMGLNTTKIKCLLDNDKKKQGRRLYGTNLKVESPQILSNVIRPHVILKAGIYNKEIIEDILININSESIFWD
jgi:SAM-dependent methyltransferase